MANGQPGLSPLQQFIGQYMETSQFLEQQRQASMQEAAMQRQMENQELEMFAGLLPQIQQPEQRAALADLFKQRNPQAGTTIDALNAAVPVSLQTRMSNVAGALTADDFIGALKSNLGLELNAEQEAQFRQREGELVDMNRRFFADLNQRDQQFTANLGLQERELEQAGALGFGQLGVAQGRLGLDAELGRGQLALGEFEAQNRLNLGMLDANVRMGTGPELMRAEQSRAIIGLKEQLSQGLLHPARRQALEQEIADREATMGRMNQLWEANLANLVGAQAAAEFGGMSLAQLIQAAEVAQRQVDEATEPGTKATANARLTLINTLLNQAQTIVPQPILEHNINRFWFDKLIPRGPGGQP